MIIEETKIPTATASKGDESIKFSTDASTSQIQFDYNTLTVSSDSDKSQWAFPSVSFEASSSNSNEEQAVKLKKVKLKDVTPEVVANCIVQFCNNHGDLITSVKLQRLVYYSQAWFLALRGKPLFPHPIHAAENGPLQIDLSKRYEAFGHEPIKENAGFVYPATLEKHIEDLMRAYGHLSSFDLETLICNEEPWKVARKKGSTENSLPEISQDHMKSFYEIQLDGE